MSDIIGNPWNLVSIAVGLVALVAMLGAALGWWDKRG